MMKNNILSHSGDNASKMRKLGGDKTSACYTNEKCDSCGTTPSANLGWSGGENLKTGIKTP